MGRGKRKASDTKTAEELKDPDADLVIDTDYHTDGLQARTFQQIYEFYKSDAEPVNREELETWQKIKRSGIHLISARPAIFPWHDMTRWVLSKFHAKGVISRADSSNLVSFALENVTNIYALPKPELIADEAYMKAFNSENSDINDWLQEWWHDEDDFKPSSAHTCRVQDFHEYYKPVVVMICRLIGEKNCNLFRKEWVPIMHAVVEEGMILNWANLLAEVMQKTLKKYLEALVQ